MARTAPGRVIALASQGDDAAALLAEARLAQTGWRRTSVRERLAVIARSRDRLAANAGDLARALDQRPVAQTLSGEILPLLASCRHLERHAARVLRTRRARGWPGFWLAGVSVEIWREPFGVVLIVAPSNYPLMLAGVQALQALAAGNAVIVKPAPGARALTQRLASLLAASGLPQGVLQVADESIETVEALLALRVDKLVFTGSSDSGKAALMRAGESLVPAVAELSGWDACLVLDGADVERAAATIDLALRFNGGRTCLAPRRVIAEKAVYARLVAALERRLSGAAGVEIDAKLVERLAMAVAEAERQGARVIRGRVTDGRAHGPCIVADVEPRMPIFGTELFGPVALVTRAEDARHAVDLANATHFALGASVFGPVRAAREAADLLDAGVVTINDAVVPVAHPELPLAPRRGSGFGTTRGREGLLEMTRPKAVAINRARRPLHLALRGDPPPELLQAYIEAAYRRGAAARLGALAAAGRALFHSRIEERDSCGPR